MKNNFNFFFWRIRIVNKREWIFQEGCNKKKKEKRKQWIWDDIDRGLRSSRSSHNTNFTTHAIWLFTRLSGGFNQAFFSFSMVTKKPLRQGHWPLHRCTALFGLSTVSGHSKLRELVSMTNGNVVNLWHYDKFLHHLEQQTPLVNWTTRLLRLRSCLILGFHLASLRVHFSIRALTSIPRFIISF